MMVIKKIIWFLFSVIIIYGIIIILLCFIPYKGKPLVYITNDYYHWKGGSTYEKFRKFSSHKKRHAVIIGSSRAYRGYDPRIFGEAGYDVWNLGTGAQTINNTYFVAKNYITPGNCDLLIIDIYSGAFKNISIESSSDLIQNISSDKAALEIAWDTRDIRALNMLAVRYLTANENSMFADKDYVGFGFSERHDKLPEKMRTALSGNLETNVKDAEYEVKYLDMLLQFCKENGIKAVLTYAPVSDFYSEEEHRRFLAEISEVISKHSVPLLDYSKSLKISTLEHFYDEAHMNYDGVRIFNQALINDLEEKQLLIK